MILLSEIDKQRTVNQELHARGHLFFNHHEHGRVRISDTDGNGKAYIDINGKDFTIDLGMLKPMLSKDLPAWEETENCHGNPLDTLCCLCGKGCGADRDESQVSDQKLFDDCLKILLDDIDVFFEYLKLHSPLGDVICNLRSFISFITGDKKLLLFHDRSSKQPVTIPPGVFFDHFKRALSRWGHSYPADFSFAPLESLLGETLHQQRPSHDPIFRKRLEELVSNQADPLFLEQASHYIVPPARERDELVRVPKLVETTCPECGETVNVMLEDKDLELLRTGSRYIHKIIEHGSGEDIHGVNIFIDSEFRVRRKTAVKIIKNIICP